MDKACEKCGYDLKGEEHKFCPECGFNLLQAKGSAVCEKCGFTLKDGTYKFCPECGSNLHQALRPTPPPSNIVHQQLIETKLQTEKKYHCRYCGHISDITAFKCQNCGRNFRLIHGRVGCLWFIITLGIAIVIGAQNKTLYPYTFIVGFPVALSVCVYASRSATHVKK